MTTHLILLSTNGPAMHAGRHHAAEGDWGWTLCGYEGEVESIGDHALEATEPNVTCTRCLRTRTWRDQKA